MPYKIIYDNINQDIWETYANNFLDHNIYQTWSYQKVRAENDKQELKRIIVNDDNSDPILMCNIRIKYIKFLGLKIGYVQSGPLMIRKDGNLYNLVEALKEFNKFCFNESINVLRITPNICENELGKKIMEIIKSAGFSKINNSPPYHTLIVSLKGSEEEIRARFNRESRRLLRKAEEKDIEIREGTESEFFKILIDLYSKAKDRKGFKGVDPYIFARTQEILDTEKKTKVIIAYISGQPVTAHATTHFGNTAVPILTASNETGLREGTSYLVWWKVYQRAKSLGMEYYDLGGIDKKKNPQGYLFKRHIGGEEIFHIGSFELYGSSIVQRLWNFAFKFYRILKNK